MEHTEKTKLFEKVRADLIDCHLEIKCTELTEEELDAAKNLINFCRVICEQFEGEFQRFTEIDNNNF